MVRCVVGGRGSCQAPLLEAISAAFHPVRADLGAQDKSAAESGLGFDVLFFAKMLGRLDLFQIPFT